jgi:uncharacterized protein YbjT (DUF2867 family)
MYVITGATGRTGSVVARTLLEQKQPVRVVVRDAAKGAEWKQRGAEVAVAALDDPAALGRAFAGAESAYLMVPPVYGSPSMLEGQRKIIDALAANRPKHVVLLSSMGAQLPSGTGPIVTLHRAEEKLRPDAALRAAYFMENWAGPLPVARQQGILPSALRGLISMVAADDIGRTAAGLLLEKHQGVVELAGPEDYSAEDVARTVSKILGREINWVAVPDEAIAPSLVQAGFSPDVAELFRELTVALSHGTIAWLGKPRRGKVTLEEKLRQLLQ